MLWSAHPGPGCAYWWEVLRLLHHALAGPIWLPSRRRTKAFGFDVQQYDIHLELAGHPERQRVRRTTGGGSKCLNTSDFAQLMVGVHLAYVVSKPYLLCGSCAQILLSDASAFHNYPSPLALSWSQPYLSGNTLAMDDHQATSLHTKSRLKSVDGEYQRRSLPELLAEHTTAYSSGINSPSRTFFTADDTCAEQNTSRQVDYLNHYRSEEDVCSSWRHVISMKERFELKSRLENASWRACAKRRNRLPSISPERINWYVH